MGACPVPPAAAAAAGDDAIVAVAVTGPRGSATRLRPSRHRKGPRVADTPCATRHSGPAVCCRLCCSSAVRRAAEADQVLQLPEDQRVQGRQVQGHAADVAVVGAHRRPAWGWGRRQWRGWLGGGGVTWQRFRCQQLVRLALRYQQHAGLDLGGLQGLCVWECV